MTIYISKGSNPHTSFIKNERAGGQKIRQMTSIGDISEVGQADKFTFLKVENSCHCETTEIPHPVRTIFRECVKLKFRKKFLPLKYYNELNRLIRPFEQPNKSATISNLAIWSSLDFFSVVISFIVDCKLQKEIVNKISNGKQTRLPQCLVSGHDLNLWCRSTIG